MLISIYRKMTEKKTTSFLCKVASGDQYFELPFDFTYLL